MCGQKGIDQDKCPIIRACMLGFDASLGIRAGKSLYRLADMSINVVQELGMSLHDPAGANQGTDGGAALDQEHRMRDTGSMYAVRIDGICPRHRPVWFPPAYREMLALAAPGTDTTASNGIACKLETDVNVTGWDWDDDDDDSDCMMTDADLQYGLQQAIPRP